MILQWSAIRGTSRPDTPAQTGGNNQILPDSDDYNPDDTYRCIINLSLNLAKELPNDAAHGSEAGWRYEPEHLGDATGSPSSTTGMLGGTPFGAPMEVEEERMGRGERSKKKRRFRSLSPLGRGGTPGGRGTPDVGGYGGRWWCSDRSREIPVETLCANCGYLYERDQRLPRQSKNLHLPDVRAV
ncbi:hypothetical protein FSST1_006754 [Fusarium sambucinum]